MAFEDAYSKASRSIDDPEHFHIHAHPWPFRTDKWSATTGESVTPMDETTDEIRYAGEALVEFANALPLVIDKDVPIAIAEMLSARITDYDNSLWIDVRSPTEDALVKLLTSADEAAYFAQSRAFDEDTSDWALAAQTRCVRKTVFDSFDLIEPGAIWFVEWLDAHGAQTIFSCEGHPHDFHVTFFGPYELAYALADIDDLVVTVFRTQGQPAKGQWKMELTYWPETREERDEALRKLAADLAKLDLA